MVFYLNFSDSNDYAWEITEGDQDDSESMEDVKNSTAKNPSDALVAEQGPKEYQENHWLLHQLPYSKEMLSQADETFQKIKIGLATSIAQHRIDPDLNLWLNEFTYFINRYGRRFSKEDHVLLIRLLIPWIKSGQGYEDTDSVLNLLILLLSKKYLLKREDLTIDWRPLFDAYVEATYKKKTFHTPPALSSKLSQFVGLARAYFHQDAPQQILDETRPYICSVLKTTDSAFYLRATFMPMNFSDEVQKTHGAGLWFEESWYWLTENCESNADYIRSINIFMFARLAYEAPDFIKWDEERLGVLFTWLIRQLALPNSGLKPSTNLQNDWFCTIIGHTLGSYSHEAVMAQLKSLCSLLESTCHPSNYGTHTGRILSIFRDILKKMVARVKYERFPKKRSTLNQIPERMKLKQEQIDEVINIFLPCMKQLLFTKNYNAGSMFRSACALSPKIILPHLLELVYPALDCHEDPKRLYSILYALKGCLSTLVREKGLRKHAIRLVKSLLPGVDQNDTLKMCLCSYIAGMLLRLVKITDCSKAAAVRDDLSDEEKELCEETKHFKEIIEGYLDRFFGIISSMGEVSYETECVKQSINNDSRVLEKCLHLVFESIFHNSSKELFSLAFDRFYEFFASNLFDNNVLRRILGVAAYTVVESNPEMCFPKMLKLIMRKLKENVTDDDYVEEKPHFSVTWWLQMTYYIISAPPAQMLLENWTDVIHVIEMVQGFTKPNDASTGADNIIRQVLNVLCYCRVLSWSKNRAITDEPLIQYLPIRHWCEPVDKSTWKSEWYIPTEDALSKAEELFQVYFVPSLNALQSPNGMDKKVRLLHLQRLTAMFEGASFSIAPFEGPEISAADAPTFEQPPQEILKTRGAPELLLSGQNIRDMVLECLEKLVEYVESNAEDDVKSTSKIIHLLGSVESYYGVESTRLTNSQDLYTKEDRLLFNPLDGPWKNQAMNVESAVALVHLRRLTVNIGVKTCEQNIRVLRLLTRLSTTSYAENRRRAQKKFNDVSYWHNHIDKFVMDDILKYLDPKEKCSHDQKKGALYLLKNRNAVWRGSFETQRKIWRTLLLIDDGEKKSMINLIKTVHRTIRSYYMTPRIEFEVDEKAKHVAREILGLELEMLKKPADYEEKLERKKRDYYALAQMLYDFSQDRDLHWRRVTMALELFSSIARRDMPNHPEFLPRFLENILHDKSSERLSAINMVWGFLLLTKPKAVKKEIVIDEGTPSKWPITCGLRKDNRFLVYEKEKLPKTDEEWDKFEFVKKEHKGWYTWAKKLKVAAPLEEQMYIDREEADLTKEEKIILEKLRDPQLHKRFVSLYTVQGISHNDAFKVDFFGFFKQLARNFNDLICDPMQKILNSILNVKPDSGVMERISKKKQHHRLAAEIVAGLIKGSRLWRWKRQRTMWEWLGPFLGKVFDALTDEVYPVWRSMMYRVCDGSDPRALNYLNELIMERVERKFATTPSEVDVSMQIDLKLGWKLCYEYGWRGLEFGHRLLKLTKPILGHHLIDVRCINTSGMKNVAKYHYFSTRVDADMPESLLPFSDDKCLGLYEDLVKTCWDLGLNKADKDEDSVRRSRQALREAIYYCVYRLRDSHKSLTGPMIKLLPLFCHYSNEVGDEDLHITCRSFMKHRMQTAYVRSDIVAELVSEATKIIDSRSHWWKTRIAALQLIHLMIMNNCIVFKAHISDLEAMIINSLEDNQLEVRLAGRNFLRDLFLTGFFSTDGDLLDRFLKSAGEDSQQGHAAVFGLSAAVLAAPYNIPNHLPPILIKLVGIANTTKKEVLKKTAKDTLAEFKRTHQDSWHEHRKHFTENQLNMISGFLTSSNYYA